LRFSTGVTIFPNYTAQVYWLRGAWGSPPRYKYIPLNASSEEAYAAITFVTNQISRGSWFNMLPPVSYVGAFPIEVFRGDTITGFHATMILLYTKLQ